MPGVLGALLHARTFMCSEPDCMERCLYIASLSDNIEAAF